MDKKEITQIFCSDSIELFYFIVIIKLYLMSFFFTSKIKTRNTLFFMIVESKVEYV